METKQNLYRCPGCEKTFEELRIVHTESGEPFTASPLYAMEGLDVYGVYDAEKVIVCQHGEILHFRFVHDGEERLVHMVSPNYDEIQQAHERHSMVIRQCEHEGCANNGEPCYINQFDLEPNEYLCDEHKYEEGYCKWCNLFYSGIEDFDFDNHNQLCASCLDQLRDESGEYDYEDWEDWDWFEDQF